jgi:sec-independent protein translocase protein TatA
LRVGTPEIILIVLLILLLFGDKKLPELARGIGRGLSEFRRATREVRREIESSLDIPGESQRADTKTESSGSVPTQSTPRKRDESENPPTRSS